MKRVDLLADSSIVECLMMDVSRRHVRMLKRVAVAMVVALAVGAAASAQTNGSGAAGASGQASAQTPAPAAQQPVNWSSN